MFRELGAIIVVVAAVVAWGYWTDPGVWYKPGDIKTITLRDPIIATYHPLKTIQLQEWKWAVTDDINLYFHTTFSESVYTRKHIITVLVIHDGPGIPYLEPWEALQLFEDESQNDYKYKYSYRFVYYHQRGSGNSTRFLDTFENSNFLYYKTNLRSLVSVYGIQEHIADVERIRELLSTDGSLDYQEYKLLIVGHGFGGFLATLYAFEYPDQVKGMVLVEPTNLLMSSVDKDLLQLVRSNFNDRTDREYFDAWKDEYLDFSPSVFKKSDKQIARLHAKFFQFWGKAGKWDRPSPPLDMVGGWMVYGIYISMGLSHDYTSVLKGINVPVLLIHGDNDLVSLYNVANNYQHIFKESHLEEISDVGHFPFKESPKKFASLLSGFLLELEGRKEESLD